MTAAPTWTLARRTMICLLVGIIGATMITLIVTRSFRVAVGHTMREGFAHETNHIAPTTHVQTRINTSSAADCGVETNGYVRCAPETPSVTWTAVQNDDDTVTLAWNDSWCAIPSPTAYAAMSANFARIVVAERLELQRRSRCPPTRASSSSPPQKRPKRGLAEHALDGPTLLPRRSPLATMRQRQCPLARRLCRRTRL